MKPLPAGNEFAALLGIDWADAKHDICLQAQRRLARVQRPAPPSRCHRGVGGCAATALPGAAHGRVPGACQGPARLCPAEVRTFWSCSRSIPQRWPSIAKPSPREAKDDPTDVEPQVDLLLRHRDKLKRPHPQGVAMRTLPYFVEQPAPRRHYSARSARALRTLDSPPQGVSWAGVVRPIPQPSAGSNRSTVARGPVLSRPSRPQRPAGVTGRATRVAPRPTPDPNRFARTQSDPYATGRRPPTELRPDGRLEPRQAASSPSRCRG